MTKPADSKEVIFYHGSAAKLNVFDNLHPADNWNYEKTQKLKAVFTTTDFFKAHIFGLRKCFFDKGLLLLVMYPQKGEQSYLSALYMQKINVPQDIEENFYVYQVSADKMQQDKEDEYFSYDAVSIKTVSEYNLWKFIKANDFDIRLLDSSFDEKYQDLPAFERVEIAEKEYIPQGRWNRISVDDLFLRKTIGNMFPEEVIVELINMRNNCGHKKMLDLLSRRAKELKQNVRD
ncbi:MAG: hypothetical protein LBF28_01200 [Rickettsiales bacterium]|jgi:hypothetical protein|nr:hypothetical protein [Rickettsiales bacterium]